MVPIHFMDVVIIVYWYLHVFLSDKDDGSARTSKREKYCPLQFLALLGLGFLSGSLSPRLSQ